MGASPLLQGASLIPLPLLLSALLKPYLLLEGGGGARLRAWLCEEGVGAAQGSSLVGALAWSAFARSLPSWAAAWGDGRR